MQNILFDYDEINNNQYRILSFAFIFGGGL